MTEQEIQTLAQSLVDLEVERKRIENEKSIIKLDIWENAKGGIKCNGGTVYWVDAGDEMRFNKDRLREVLIEQGMDDNQVNDIFERSKLQMQREANIKIKLDK